MNTMNPVKIYDYLTMAREKVFDSVRALPPEQYAREFNFGLKTLGSTLTHTMITEWAYTQRMQGKSLPPYNTWPIQDEKPPAFTVIERTWCDQAPSTRQIIEQALKDARWNEEFDYTSKSREGKTAIITVTLSDICTQMMLHEMHHRAQVMTMLRELGVVVQDIDFGYLMFKRRIVSD